MDKDDIIEKLRRDIAILQVKLGSNDVQFNRLLMTVADLKMLVKEVQDELSRMKNERKG